MAMARDSGLARLLDANANRAREGLRVLEDAARFVLDDGPLTTEAKAIRHGITACINRLTLPGLTSSRDVAGDVGAESDLESELERPSIGAVIAAASHRTTQALRSLEEYAKVVDTEVGVAFEAMRYRAYDLEALMRERVARHAPSTWRVMVILSEAQCRRPWREVLSASIAGGADAIQVREKDLAPREFLERARAVVRVCHPAGVAVIINDSPEVALAAGADGVHLGQRDFPVEDARRVIGGTMVLGGSANSIEEAARNYAAGCDYCGIGRIFESDTKPNAPEAGASLLEAFTKKWPTWPHLAIGGITPEHVDQLISCGAAAVAVCGAVCGAEEPAEVVAALRLALETKARRVP